jgi:two-component system sensor histidine kinase KdpD
LVVTAIFSSKVAAGVESVKICGVNMLSRGSAVRFAVAALVVAAITYTYFKLIHVNPTTVGFTLLLAVLVVSAAWGLPYAVFMAIVATLAYNRFFFAPIGVFTIADPQNWVALGAFLITAIIASHLSDRARREALNAHRRRQDVERLYAFSQELLVIDNILELLNSIPRQIVHAFGVTAAAMFLTERGKTYYSDLAAQGMMDTEALRATTGRGEPTADETAGRYFVPLRIGVRALGAVGVVGGSLSRETLEAIGSLIAIAVERAGAIEKLSRAEAARESEKLRTALLDSVTHEFRTPLTSILASAKSLISDDELNEAGRKELLAVINEEGERLDRLVGEAAEMAQLDAREVELQLRPHDIREAIEGALEDSSRALKGHPVEMNVPDDLPMARFDLRRIQEVIAHLLDNAGKYAATGTPIHISAEVCDGKLRTSVADHGPGIDEFEQGLIFDKFYRGRGQRAVHGTGMGLAICKAILEAHGGSIGVTSQLGHGSVFYFTLPLQ